MKVPSSYKIFISALIVVLSFSATILPVTNADAAFATSSGPYATSGGAYATSGGANPYALNTSNIAAVIPSVIGCTGIVNTYHNLINGITNGGINAVFSTDTNPADVSTNSTDFGPPLAPNPGDGSVVNAQTGAGQDLGLLTGDPELNGIVPIGVGQGGQNLPDITPLTGASIIGNLPGNSVPTTDQPVQDLLQQLKQIFNVTKASVTNDYNTNSNANFREQCLNGVAIALAKSELASMTQKTVNWVNQGYNGNPLFVRDQQTFFNNIADQQLQSFIGPYANPANETIYPFGRQFATSAVTNQQSNFYSTSQSTLQNSLVPGATTSSFGNDFSQGGWAGWFSFTQNPQNNPLGFNLIASQQLANQTTAVQTAQQNELNQNNGFLSQKQCVQYSTTNTHGALNPADCLQWQTVTPGSVIEAQLNNSLTSATRQLELANNINQSLDAIFANLIDQLTNQGLSTLSSNVSTDSGLNGSNNSLGGAGSNSSLGVAYDSNGNQITVNQGAGWSNSDGSAFDITKDLADTYKTAKVKGLAKATDGTAIKFTKTPVPACSFDGQAIDTTYAGCHTDGNATNAASYDPYHDSKVSSAAFTATAKPQCSDGVNNDGTGLTDAANPGCHTDGDVSNANSYDPYHNSEANYSSTGIKSGRAYKMDSAPATPCATQTVNWECYTDGLNEKIKETNTNYLDPYHTPLPACTPTYTQNATQTRCTEFPFKAKVITCSVDSTLDTTYPGCHTDGDANNNNSYDPFHTDIADTYKTGYPFYDFSPTTPPLCSADGQAVDTTYPWCHTDGNAGNPNSYDPYHNPTLNSCTIKYFYPSNQTLTQGASTSLNFETTGNCAATALSQDSTVYKTDTPYTVKVTPTATTTYQLTTTNSSGYSASNSATILVGATSSCNINYFYATSASINAGTPSALKWDVTGANCPANSVILSGVTTPYANSGSQPVSPLTTTTYTLTANDTTNNSVSLGSTTINTVPQEGTGIFARSPVPQCSDGIDNDGDGLIDTNDPACHTDGDATNNNSYDPFRNTESGGGNLSIIAKEGVISIQHDYLCAIEGSKASTVAYPCTTKGSLDIIPNILPAVGELDYCIPGPNPAWASATADEINATSAYLEAIQYTPTVPPNGITLPASVSSYVQQISSGPRAQADFAKALPQVVEEVEAQVASTVNTDRIQFSKAHNNQSINDPFYGSLNNFLSQIPIVNTVYDTLKGLWYALTQTTPYDPQQAEAQYQQDVQQEYQLEQTQFQAIIQAEIKTMNTNYTTYKTHIDQLYGPNSPMQTPGSQWYLPVAATALQLTQNIRTYETSISTATSQYNQLISQTNANIYKLNAIEKTVSGIVQTAENNLCLAMSKASTGTYCEATPASLGFICEPTNNYRACNPNDPNNNCIVGGGNSGNNVNGSNASSGGSGSGTACKINAFNPDTNSVSLGNKVTITWTTSNCSSVEIDNTISGATHILFYGATVSGQNLTTPQPITFAPKYTDTYNIIAKDSAGKTINQNFIITVK